MPPGLIYEKKKQIKRKPLTKYFDDGWWTDMNDKPITEALFGDTVKFHVKMENTTEGDDVSLTLYDDDSKVKPLEEDNEDDAKGLVYTVNGQLVISDKVNGNKIVKQITLKNFEDLLKDEKDGEIELFFKGTYKDEKEIPLPSDSSRYLKVKGMPKIIFVNGHWNKIFNKIGMSPGTGGEGYWNFFTGDVKSYKSNADNYFGIKSGEPYFIDGSSLWGGSESGEGRKERGYDYAKENFDKIIKGLGNHEVFFISHSEGGASATGVAKYLLEKGIKVQESILLSTDEGDEFTIEKDYNSYQIVAGYLSKDLLTRKTIFHIDPVVMDNRINGVTRYGVYISNVGLTTVHGDTVDSKTFNLLKTLKSIHVEPAWNSKGRIVYQTTPVDEAWARIDEYVLYNKKVDLYPTLNSNVREFYKQRED